MNKAVFLDRDGTLNSQIKDGYLTSREDFKFLPNVLKALKCLAKTDYKIIVITNQSAVARGLMTVKQLEEIHASMLAEVEKAGGRIDGIYVCMHHPDDDCTCRKPKTGLLELAKASFNTSLTNSWFVGDKTVDVKTGLNAGCKTILLETGYGGNDNIHNVKPHRRAKDLMEAAKIILGSAKAGY